MGETKIIKSWSDIGVNTGGRGKLKVVCPNCRDSRTNKKDRALSVNVDKGVAHCHYCDVSYLIDDNRQESYKMEKKYIKPIWRNNTDLSEKVVRWFESRGITQHTLKRMQITEGPEYMPQHNRQMNTIQFNYFLDNELLNVKYRTGDKCFKFISNAELIPYNIDSVKGSDSVVITEGEIDALTLIQNGYTAISVPNGASDNTSYLDRFIEPYFDPVKEIIIAADTDSKGIILREALIRRFGAERCKVVDYWGEGCKDANECLVKCGASFLKDVIDKAEYVPVSGVFTVANFENELDSLYEIGLQKGVTIGHPDFDKLCSFESKRLCIITGIPGSGKSEFLDEIAELLNIRYGWKFGFFSPENFPLKYHASKIISKITGKFFSKEQLPFNEYKQVKEYMNDNFFFICPEDEYSLETILDKSRFLIRRYGVRGIVIDPWNRIEHRIPGGMNETEYISKALDQLTNFAQREDVLLFLMAHPTKLKKGPKDVEYDAPTLYDISGSANFYNKADYGISVHRRREHGYTEVHVQKVKFRHLGSVGTAKFKYNLSNGRYTDFEENKPIQWDYNNHLIKMLSNKIINSQQSLLSDDLFTENTDPLPF